MLEPLREKQERPEMDDLEEKGKNYLKKIFGKFTGYPCKYFSKLLQNIFSYYFVSDHSRHFS